MLLEWIKIGALQGTSEPFFDWLFSSSLVDGRKSVADVLSEESEVRLEQGNGITDNLDLIIALLTALSAVNVLLVTVGESLIVLILLMDQFQEILF